MAGGDWSSNEIDAAVGEYFSMLAAEIAGIAVNKAERNRALQATIPRNRGSIEFKHQNISAVMLGLGQPWITGYKPKANFQGALVEGVLRWLNSHEDWLRPRCSSNRVADGNSGQMPFQGPTPERLIRFAASPSQRNEPPLIDPEFMAAIGRKFDVAARDARNRALGIAGEEAVFAEEQRRLRAVGREDLARRARWTSQDDGDGFGYDIASFEPDGREKLIEVKTTNGWERTPFHLSANELAVAGARREAWQLVRIWDFARQPSAFVLRPPMQAHVILTPTSFLAALH
ncbi:protein NO VEIN domain-containing protein [Pseudopontixanthobacter vadosimaris]|uniref:protein NO VEIN domain-containing protein n=1 Tax=Pseudopontixanthobacter vadosimaris TaxID=2726450 RepID=UPI0014765170